MRQNAVVADAYRRPRRIPRSLRRSLEELQRECGKRELVHPDPLEVLYEYDDIRDREIVALVASSLAYGRVGQILKSVRRVIVRMGSPADFLEASTPQSLGRAFRGFKHRFSTGDDVALMLLGAKRMIERYGSLQESFLDGMKEDDETVLPALCEFTSRLNSSVGLRRSSLVPRASDGSACKRLNLFLRWMVRDDGVDPGGWNDVAPAKLIVPLDTHMHRICRALGITGRRQADMRTALEATVAFRTIAPDDPVRYDFALTRLGIRDDMELEEWIAAATVRSAMPEVDG